MSQKMKKAMCVPVHIFASRKKRDMDTRYQIFPPPDSFPYLGH